MNKDIAISVKNFSKTFRIPHEKVSLVRGAFVNLLPAVRRGKGCFSLKRNAKSILTKNVFLDTLEVLKSPVLTLWAWRGFILS